MCETGARYWVGGGKIKGPECEGLSVSGGILEKCGFLAELSAKYCEGKLYWLTKALVNFKVM